MPPAPPATTGRTRPGGPRQPQPVVGGGLARCSQVGQGGAARALDVADPIRWSRGVRLGRVHQVEHGSDLAQALPLAALARILTLHGGTLRREDHDGWQVRLEWPS